MGSWTKFNRQFKMTPRDWAEWRATKNRYRKGSFHPCPGCGATIFCSPLVTFLLYKGKKSPYCSECEKRRGR